MLATRGRLLIAGLLVIYSLFANSGAPSCVDDCCCHAWACTHTFTNCVLCEVSLGTTWLPHLADMYVAFELRTTQKKKKKKKHSELNSPEIGEKICRLDVLAGKGGVPFMVSLDFL